MTQLRPVTRRILKQASPYAGPLGLVLMLALLVHVLMVPFARAEEGQPGQMGRTTTIDFEEELIEGMNQRPLDSLTQLSDKRRRGADSHLYSKRRSFRSETRETLFELPLAQ